MFLYTISCMQGGHTTLTLIFIIFYMTAALLQVRPGRSRGEPQVWTQWSCATTFSGQDSGELALALEEFLPCYVALA